MEPEIIEPPEELAVLLEDAKDHLRVDGNDEDNLIEDKVEAAVEACENYTHRQLVTAGLRLSLPGAPRSSVLELPRPKLQRIDRILFVPPGGSLAEPEQMDPELYDADTYSLVGSVVLREGAAWPATSSRPGSFRVEYTAGYGRAAAVPKRIKSGILLLAGHLFRNREAVITGTIATELPNGVLPCWRHYRVPGI